MKLITKFKSGGNAPKKKCGGGAFKHQEGGLFNPAGQELADKYMQMFYNGLISEQELQTMMGAILKSGYPMYPPLTVEGDLYEMLGDDDYGDRGGSWDVDETAYSGGGNMNTQAMRSYDDAIERMQDRAVMSGDPREKARMDRIRNTYETTLVDPHNRVLRRGERLQRMPASHPRYNEFVQRNQVDHDALRNEENMFQARLLFDPAFNENSMFNRHHEDRKAMRKAGMRKLGGILNRNPYLDYMTPLSSYSRDSFRKTY